MNIEAMQQALNALEYHTMQTRPIHHTDKAIEALRQAIEQAEKQESAVEHLWECLGRWSSYLAVNGTEANLAPPNWLLDAVIAATSQPRKEWVGLNWDDIPDIFVGDIAFMQGAKWALAKLKEKNGG